MTNRQKDPSQAQQQPGGGSKGPQSQTGTGQKQDKGASDDGTPNLPRTQDERGDDAGSQDSLVGDPTGAFKERP